VSSPAEERSYDWPGIVLSRFVPSHPRLAFRLAGTIGSARHRLTGRWPSQTEVRTLFPHLGPDEAMRIAHEIGALTERNRVLVRSILRYGLDPIRPIVSMKGAVDRPCILGTFHVGALHALGPVLETIGRPVLAFRRGPIFTPRPPLVIETTTGNEQQRAAAFHRAVITLRDGGVVVLALDDVPARSIESQCLGRTLPLAPGAFALSRLTGAPVLPLVARWTSAGVSVIAGSESLQEDTAATWLERYLVESPGEITLGLLRNLLS
jgi:hypothetical protein